MRRCSLPGCGVLIEDITGRPPRRYCTAAHRSLARQARRAATQHEQESRLAETLPWLREPAEEAPPPFVPPPTPPRIEVPVPAAPVGARAAVARRWALLSSRPDGPRDPRSDGQRRRRAIAMLGAAGILAGGYAVTASEPSNAFTTPGQAMPITMSDNEWVSHAQITLQSLNRQLDTIAETEDAWSRLPEDQRVSMPSELRAMLDRRLLLQQRKATLQSQLATYESLSQTREELRLTEQYLAAAEKALQEAAPDSTLSPEQAAAIAQLRQERDARLAEREAKRAEVARLEENVQHAVETPLPDDGEKTDEVSEDVREVIRTGESSDQEQSPTPARPEVVGGREGDQSQERQDTDNSAPPDPRGPRDESGEPREEPGPVGKVVGAVGGVLSGGESDEGSNGKSGRAAEKSEDGTEAAGTEAADKEAADKEAADKEAADKKAADKKAADKKAADKKAADKKAADKKAVKHGAADGGAIGRGGDRADPGAQDGDGGGGLLGRVGDTVGGGSDNGRGDSDGSDSGRGDNGRGDSGGDTQAAPQPPPRAVAPKRDLQEPAAPQAQESAPQGGGSAEEAGMGIARAIVGGVPGGQYAAPAVDAAMAEGSSGGSTEQAPAPEVHPLPRTEPSDSAPSGQQAPSAQAPRENDQAAPSVSTSSDGGTTYTNEYGSVTVSDSGYTVTPAGSDESITIPA